MEKEKEQQLIIPTQEIAFAALKDGSYITNFKQSDGTIARENIATLFKVIVKFVKDSDDKLFLSYAIADALLGREVDFAIRERMMEIEKEVKANK